MATQISITNNVTVIENGIAANLTVSLAEAVDVDITVDYATQDDTATAPSDYTAVLTTPLTIPAGELSGTISVPIVDDRIPEDDEDFFVNLSNPSNDATITNNRGVVTILDNDEDIDLTGLGGGTFDFSSREEDLNITGSSEDDNITSGSGNDFIDAGGGTNTVDSGAGDDTIVGAGTSEITNNIDGGIGDDTVTYDGNLTSFLPVTRFPNGTVRVGSNTDSLTNVETLEFTNRDVLVEELPITSLDDPLIRFQNSDVQGTFLFAGEAEAINVRNNFTPPFVEEGFAFNVSLDAQDGLVRFNRFQNTDVPGTYLFANEEESVSIRRDFPNFNEEGVAFYVYGADYNVGTDYYRFQNTEVPGTYIFVNEVERDNILNNFPQFALEGIAFEV